MKILFSHIAICLFLSILCFETQAQNIGKTTLSINNSANNDSLFSNSYIPLTKYEFDKMMLKKRENPSLFIPLTHREAELIRYKDTLTGKTFSTNLNIPLTRREAELSQYQDTLQLINNKK